MRSSEAQIGRIMNGMYPYTSPRITVIGKPDRKVGVPEAERAEQDVERPTTVEQALPGVDAHQVADPQGRDQQDEDRTLWWPPSGGEVRHGVSEDEADRRRCEERR